MSFTDFLGNQATTRQLRESVTSGRLPQAIILSGPRGAGKFTLAMMLAQTVNCLQQPIQDGLPDYCGVCSYCSRAALALPLEERIAEAVAAREELRETDKKETRILIQPHPDLLIIPPDPPQLLIKLGQVRSLIRGVYRIPSQARRAVYIFTAASFMKEAANSLLKVLEEPPAHAMIILLAEHPGELLPTIRSRAAMFRIGPISPDEMEALIAARRTDLGKAQRALLARLAEGTVGRALTLYLPTYMANRQSALVILRHALLESDHTALFKTTESFRAGAEGAEKTVAMLRPLSSLLEDLLLLQSGVPHLVRNIDILGELQRLSANASMEWLEAASRALDQVESGMRRNLLRSLALDSFAVGLTRT